MLTTEKGHGSESIPFVESWGAAPGLHSSSCLSVLPVRREDWRALHAVALMVAWWPLKSLSFSPVARLYVDTTEPDGKYSTCMTQ